MVFAKLLQLLLLFSGCEQEDDGGFEFVATLFSVSLETTGTRAAAIFWNTESFRYALFN